MIFVLRIAGQAKEAKPLRYSGFGVSGCRWLGQHGEGRAQC